MIIPKSFKLSMTYLSSITTGLKLTGRASGSGSKGSDDLRFDKTKTTSLGL